MAKIVKQKDCENGNHQFVVSQWLFDSKSQKANGWTCQRCLLEVQGKNDICKQRESIHADNGNSETASN